MNIEISNKGNLRYFAKKALDENLYIEGFDLKKTLNKVLKSKDKRLNS